MAERTSITQVVQVGVESTPGTAVAANRKLPSLQLGTSIEGDFTKTQAAGLKFPSIFSPGKEWSSAKFTAQPTYDELVYLLSSLVAYAAPTQQSSTTAYLWTHTPASAAEDTVKTFTVEQGSSVRAHKFAHGIVTELTLSGDRSKVELSGTFLGQQVTDGITLASSPTVVAQVPILPKEFDVYVDTASGSLGGTKLDRVLSWELSLKNRFSPLWTVDSAKSSWATVVETAVDATLKLRVAADSNGMGLLTPMRAGATRFARLKATSAALAGTAIPYSMTFDMAGQIGTAPGEIGDTDGVYAIDWTFNAVHDATWAKALTFAVINKLTAL